MGPYLRRIEQAWRDGVTTVYACARGDNTAILDELKTESLKLLFVGGAEKRIQKGGGRGGNRSVALGVLAVSLLGPGGGDTPDTE